jgi:hypothetical protein
MPSGCPKLEFTPEQIESASRLAGYGCTYDDIADFLEVSVDTVRDRINDELSEFSKAIKKSRAGLRERLRIAQIQVAIGNGENRPSTAMLIWLGKQYLGQREPEKVEPDDNKDALDKLDRKLDELAALGKGETNETP